MLQMVLGKQIKLLLIHPEILNLTLDSIVVLFYICQDAQQERSTFVSSLLPLLSEYSLQPPVPDAQSIVSNVKVKFK